MKVQIKKEINISNATIANELVKQGGIFEYIDDFIAEDMLYEQYNVEYQDAEKAVSELNMDDYMEIFGNIASIITMNKKEIERVNK